MMTRTISHYLQCTASLFSMSPFCLEVDSAFEKRNFDNCDTILLMFNFLTVLGGGGGGLFWCMTSVPEERQL